MPRLTRRTVEAARPRKKDYFIFDGELPGFGLRVMASGKKSYLLQYRAGGRTRRITFGQHGPMTPDQARKEAIAHLAAIRAGKNPAEERDQSRNAPTIEALSERFLTEHVAHHCKASTAREYKRSMLLFINPAFGKRGARDITRADISQLHHQMRHIPYQANRTLGVLSKMFELAELWGLRPDSSNPCRHVKRFPERKCERFLNPKELARLGQLLREVEAEGSESPAAVAAIRLLIFTGCRLGEILTLRWDYVDDRVLRFPDSKSGEKEVYIGHPAREVLAGIERQPGNPYVIVGKKPGAHLVDLQHPWRRIRKRAGLVDVRIHDLRHSFASGAVALGESLPMIGKLLGHSQVQTTARYAHLAAEPVQTAAERVSTSIANIVNGVEEPDRKQP